MKKRAYGLSTVRATRSVAAPKLPYGPPQPRRYRPKIALVGCGGISAYHLRNYQEMGLQVAALCDIDRERATARAKEFFPKADVVTDYRALLARPEIEVVDVTAHAAERVPIVAAALRTGKHVLSQKPFVLDIATGKRLVQIARDHGVYLAVNQNGRWAPHWSYLSHLVRNGILGHVASIDFTVAWDHSWVKTTPFNTIQHLVLYDFAVHWFDIATVFMQGRRANSVFATVARAAAQPFDPPALAAVVADYGHAQVRWTFNSANCFDQSDRTQICGSAGTAISFGPSLSAQTVTLTTKRGTATPRLEGTWFVNGFQGAMGELLCAIEERREPAHSAENNLRSLELVYAAIASAEFGRPIKPGAIKGLTGKLLAKCLPITK